jgi:dolichyl-phosphate beta-glucosyltransferase
MRALSIIPVADVTGAIWQDLCRQAERLPFRVEFVLPADGSSGTAERIGPFVEVLRLAGAAPAGSAAAVRAAVMRASGELVVLLRPDGSVPLSEVLRLVPVFERGAQVALGSRYLGEAGTAGQPWRRLLGHALVNSVVRLLMLGSVRDSRCGLKCFSAAAARHLCAASDDASPNIELELLGLARRLGFTLVEVPVRWQPWRRGALAALKDNAAFLAALLRVRWRIAGRPWRRPAEGAV